MWGSAFPIVSINGYATYSISSSDCSEEDMRGQEGLEITIPSQNSVSTKIGWKSVLLGTSSKSTKTGLDSIGWSQ